MSATNPTTLTVTMQDATTVVVSIPQILQNMQSGQDISTLTGFNSVDTLVASIFKRGYVYDSTRSIVYAASYIKSIVWS